MKARKLELDVDFIGGQGPLTAEEEKAVSIFFKERRTDKSPPNKKKAATITKKGKVKS